jgi:hypothetical protein
MIVFLASSRSMQSNLLFSTWFQVKVNVLTIYFELL